MQPVRPAPTATLARHALNSTELVLQAHARNAALPIASPAISWTNAQSVNPLIT